MHLQQREVTFESAATWIRPSHAGSWAKPGSRGRSDCAPSRCLAPRRGGCTRRWSSRVNDVTYAVSFSSMTGARCGLPAYVSQQGVDDTGVRAVPVSARFTDSGQRVREIFRAVARPV